MKYIYDRKKRNYSRKQNCILQNTKQMFYSQMGSLLSLKLFTLILNEFQNLNENIFLCLDIM